jgi:hypothetical protein
MPKLCPQEVDAPNCPKQGPKNYWLFIFQDYVMDFIYVKKDFGITL